MAGTSAAGYALRRLIENWKLVLVVFVGVTTAATLIAGGPIYLKSLRRIGFAASVDSALSSGLNILTIARDVRVDGEEIQRVDRSVENIVREHVGSMYEGHDRYLRTSNYLLDPTPVFAEPLQALVVLPESGARPPDKGATRGYLINLQELADHVIVVQGRMPGDILVADESTNWLPLAEAVVGTSLADRLDLELGQVITLAATSRGLTKTSARIVGFVEPTDASDGYWQGRSELFFGPADVLAPDGPGAAAGNGGPPLALMVTPTVAAKLPGQLVRPSTYAFSGAYFVTVSGLEDHVTFVEGRAASDTISIGERGPLLEAVIGWPLTETFDVGLGDVVQVTPFLDEDTWLTVRIVGIARRTDLREDYWRWGTSSFFERPNQDSATVLALMIGPRSMAEGLGGAYPATLASSAWYFRVGKESLRGLSMDDVSRRLDGLEKGLAGPLPAHITSTGIRQEVSNFENHYFFASIPILILLTTMVVTVLYFLAMMVSYLVVSREADATLLRSRGASSGGLVRLYGLEGLLVTAIGVALAPFLAMGAIALAGRLPQFDNFTRGEFLHVEFEALPFLLAAGVGLASIMLLLVSVVWGARGAPLVRRLRSSRPPLILFFHRFNLDVVVLVIGGLVFWELQSRGELVVGGLFKGVQVNEAALLAPVLLLAVVALVLLRTFPLIMRYMNGESPGLLHLIVTVSIGVLIPSIVVRDLRTDEPMAWLVPITILVGYSVAYRMASRARRSAPSTLGFLVLAALAAAFVAMEPPEPGRALFAPIVAIISVPGALLAFFVLEALSRRTPAWASLALWRMARNPSQYSWLVLLIVLAAGLATFATTVSATMARRDQNRVLYEVASDLRVSNIQRTFDGWAMLRGYADISGVAAASPGYRAMGTGQSASGRSFELLAVDAERFPAMSWFREDFSTRPLGEVMRWLKPVAPAGPLVIPDEATNLGIWAKLDVSSPPLNVGLTVRDATGEPWSLRLGTVTRRDWTELRADLPPSLTQPLELVSLQVDQRLELIGVGGAVLLDEVHATLGVGGEEVVLDGFEEEGTWTALPTSVETSSSVLSSTEDSYGGSRAAVYTFERSTPRGLSGVYRSANGGPLPVVANQVFMTTSELELGDTFVAAVDSRFVTMQIAGSIDHFPTMLSGSGGFLLADVTLFLEHMEQWDPDARATPNEFFLVRGPGAGEAFLDEIRAINPRFSMVLDRETLTESSRLNPLITAGWRAMGLVSLVIVMFTAISGYVAYLLLSGGQSRHELALVRSLGLPRRDLIALLSLEHLVVIAIGLGLGSWAGLKMSALMSPLVPLGEIATPLAPPVLVVADWWALAVVYSILAVAFGGMLLVFVKSILRLDLRDIAKAEL